jgi:PIN domain nuclease of toxin-antitoxin system
MAEAVLDASALLAVLLREPGCEAVQPLLAEGIISAVTACEIGTKLMDHRVPQEEVTAILADLGVKTVPFTEANALLAASLRSMTRSAGLSLGDRACLALAQARNLPVYTADRLWTSLGLPVDIRLIR